MDKQHKNSLELQRRNKINELHLEIYNDISAKIKSGSHHLSSISIMIRTLPVEFNLQKTTEDYYKKFGIPFTSSIKERPDQLLKDFFSAIDKALDITSAMESYEIALPNFTIIRRRILEKQRELTESFNTVCTKVFKYLPVEIPETLHGQAGKAISPSMPTEETIEEIKKITEEYIERYFELTSFLHDLRIEAQNNLLGSLFNRKLPPRKPLDPSIEVLSADEEAF